MNCTKCGAELVMNTEECQVCGEKVIKQAQTPQSESFFSEVKNNISRSLWSIPARGMALLSIFIFPAPLALLFGILTLQEIKKYPQRSGKFWGYFAIVIGSIGTLFLIIMIFSLGKSDS